jgi:phage tail-like protein
MPVTVPGEKTDVELVSSWFYVELDNGISGSFTEASGLSFEMEVVEQEDVDASGNPRTRKRPGTAKYQDIVVKRTLGPDKSFWNWAKKIRDGVADFRTNGAIVLYDIGGTELGRWTFTNAWPSKWSASDLDVGTDDLMTEEVTLAIESLERVK